MRIVKEADVRKNQILDAAFKLFMEKGYDSTSTNDILAEVGIARGTLYHHFKSKEDIMDSLIERQMQNILVLAKKIAEDKNIPVKERIFRTIMSLSISEDNEGGKTMIEHLHKPQNALMHQKTSKIMIKKIPPILAGIIEDGITEGMFHTPYPLECMEMAFVYLKSISDDDVCELSPSDFINRIEAFIFHLEILLGVKKGELSFMLKSFT